MPASSITAPNVARFDAIDSDLEARHWYARLPKIVVRASHPLEAWLMLEAKMSGFSSGKQTLRNLSLLAVGGASLVGKLFSFDPRSGKRLYSCGLDSRPSPALRP